MIYLHAGDTIVEVLWSILIQYLKRLARSLPLFGKQTENPSVPKGGETKTEKRPTRKP